MNNKLLFLCVGLVIIAMVTAPVMAAPPQNTGPIDQILTIVTDIQTKGGTLLSNLSSVQTDVTTIKTTTDTINNKLDAPPEPTSYVYFTGALCSDYYRKELEVDPNANVTYHMRWTNMGDNPAEVTFSYYNISWKNYYPPNEFWTATIQVQAHDETGNQYTLKDLSGSTIIIIKTTTNSPFVAPSMQICDMNGNRISEYNPGDFQKVEIYS
jgi:hypothetical protein